MLMTKIMKCMKVWCGYSNK